MKIFKNRHKLQNEIYNCKNLSFVPTMGGLHEGHISLIKKTKSFKGKNIVSIFVNPKQFNQKKDFKNYPRNLKKDLKILKDLKIDYVYLPTYKDIFSFKPTNKIFLDRFSKKLCGLSRKGHFEGVLNIINRFLGIIKPSRLFLGMKDFQQLYLISQHIKIRKIPTKIIKCETIREYNGVACSTRNNNLNKNQLNTASKVYRYIKLTKRSLKKDYAKLNLSIIKNDLSNLGISKIDYFKLYNLKTLKRPVSKKSQFNIFIAYYINKIRLIDNI